MKKLGKQFEQDTQDLLKLFSTKYRFYYLRLYDSTSARGQYIPAVPGDFIAVANGVPHLIENKASEKYDSLKSCLSKNVDTGQAAAHRLWHRAGGESWFLFLAHKSQMLEVWNGELVGECRATGKSLPEGGYEMRIPYALFKNGLKDLFDL